MITNQFEIMVVSMNRAVGLIDTCDAMTSEYVTMTIQYVSMTTEQLPRQLRIFRSSGPPILGYQMFEVLGTSTYDYVHNEDLKKLAKSHEMRKFSPIA